MTPLGILDLLQLRGYDATKPAKLVRHVVRRKDAGYDVDDLLRRGWFETWQAYQGRPYFDGCDYILSFSGGEGTKARFIGVYHVLGRRDGREGELAPGCPPDWKKDSQTPVAHALSVPSRHSCRDLCPVPPHSQWRPKATSKSPNEATKLLKSKESKIKRTQNPTL